MQMVPVGQRRGRQMELALALSTVGPMEKQVVAQVQALSTVGPME